MQRAFSVKNLTFVQIYDTLNIPNAICRGVGQLTQISARDMDKKEHRKYGKRS